MKIKGDIRRFLVINTADYNEDGRYAVQDVSIFELNDLGFAEEEIAQMDTLGVGETWSNSDFVGLYVMRVA